MKKIFLILLGSIIVFSACNNAPEDECGTCDGIFSQTVTMQIDGEYGPCDNGTDDLCIYVQFSDEIDEDAWEPFPNEICSFDFEPGYRYELLVKKQRIGKDDDGNVLYKYCLMSIQSMERVYL